MIDKNKIFDMLISGKSINISNEFQKECFNRYNDIMLCREFGWTLPDIQNLEQNTYNDIILILQKENYQRHKELKSK